ncbi:flagellar basal body rod protein FlgC [Pararhodospirillum photometricum]|uniref:Flagellar basal-body rod protein FlgC n=1 Tax=Pararhodospirillum photometricum DSM 122 TaxID=1150469 RepID=H6SJ45_PARPM|nr:flagellar basal body rod protein FlgC [Pararhodospirillum photometricum]CCG08010.1 Flagellar basal-body rod protein FlgC [Pararhodospirillum photometricum DSM 122]
MDELQQSAKIATSGLKAQTERLRTIAQNMANADSIAERQGEDPYRRRIVSFRNVVDREIGTALVKTGRVSEDMTPFNRKYDPGNPAADDKGYVLAPNVNPMVELMDMREAQRSYEANLNVVGLTRKMTQSTIELLK